MQEWIEQIVRNAEQKSVGLNLKTIGFIIICVGFGCIWENIFHPKNFRMLMKEYESAKAKGKKPTFDANAGYIHNQSRKIGVFLMGAGGIFWIIGYLLKR